MNRHQRRGAAPTDQAGGPAKGKGKPSIVQTGVMLVGIVICGSAIVVLARPSDTPPLPASGNAVSTAGLTGQSTGNTSIDAVNLDAPPSPRPANYFYDQFNNRHWVTACDHWHPGQPPTAAPTIAGSNGDITLQGIDNPFGRDFANQLASQTGGGTTPSVRPIDVPEWPMPNPPDMYFDQPNNRHFHAGHGHWHEGPPPPAGSSTPPLLGSSPRRGTGTGTGTTGDEGDSPLRENQ